MKHGRIKQIKKSLVVLALGIAPLTLSGVGTGNAVAVQTALPESTPSFSALGLTSTDSQTSDLTLAAGTVTTPTETVSASPTISPTPMPTVSANSQWKPVIKAFDGVDMVLVPPGCFMMGISQADADALNKQYGVTGFEHQSPQNQVCFDHPFWIDRTDVTEAQFASFEGLMTYQPHFVGPQRPVENITWFEARDFCVVKRQARLPTEAEWEYAARGPDDLIYPWGNTFVASDVVFSGNSTHLVWNVGSKPGGKSWAGALDMSGNVFQWTSSLFKPYPYDTTDGREDETASGERVVRGGDYTGADYFLRAATRGRALPTRKGDNDGFRCARSS